MATIIQSTFTARNDIALPGTFSEAYDDRRISTRISRGMQIAGLGTFKVPGSAGGAGSSFVESCGRAFQTPTPAVAASVNAIVTSRATSTSALVLSGTALNGATAGTVMQPGRLITLVLSNNAAFLASTARIKGTSALTGQPISETLTIPSSGNVTLTTTNYFSQITSVEMDVQGGTGGSFTVGVAALSSGLALADILGVVVREPIKTGVFASSLYNFTGLPVGQEGNYIDSEPFNVLSKGGIWVITEVAVSDQDPIYMRVATGSGGSQLGSFRNDADSATAVLVPGRFTRNSAVGLAPAYLNLLG